MEDRVIGAQEVLAVASAIPSPEMVRPSKSLIAHGAGAIVAVGTGEVPKSSDANASDAVRPGPVDAPVSNSLVAPSDTRVKRNLGQTFNVESNVLEFIVIDPVEDLKTDRPTLTFHDSVEPLLYVTVIGLMLLKESPVIVSAVLPPGAETDWCR